MKIYALRVGDFYLGHSVNGKVNLVYDLEDAVFYSEKMIAHFQRQVSVEDVVWVNPCQIFPKGENLEIKRTPSPARVA